MVGDLLRTELQVAVTEFSCDHVNHSLAGIRLPLATTLRFDDIQDVLLKVMYRANSHKFMLIMLQ